ncbi:MAG TPA: hypothetical protein VMT28_13585 [Terriglobales bacterium]|jgi:hypothetical protein|nr:hypothetical protein [Terriglobales bacterium]
MLQKLICVLCVLFASVVNVFALDREAFTFTNYELDVRVEPEQQRLAVRGKITLRNDSSSPQKNLFLQISSSLSWRSLQVSGKPVQFVSQTYLSDIDHTGAVSEAIVTLPQSVPTHGDVEVEVGYEGTIPPDITRLTGIGVPEEIAKHSDWDQIGAFTAVRGMGYVLWYPVATESADIGQGNDLFETLGRWKEKESDSQMRVHLCSTTFPALMNDASGPATPLSKDQSSPNCGDHSFAPLGRIVPTFVLADFSLLDRPAVNIRYLPNHKAVAEDYALAAELAAPFVTEWFGAPRKKAETVELSDSEAAPFESGNMLLTPLNPSADARLMQMTAVHQLTHAAFPSARAWIYEGLAHFAQAEYRERQSGRQAAIDFMGQQRTALANAENTIAAERDAKSAANESLINTSLEELSRSKAMYVWWMLRDMVGEAALKKALAAYHAEEDKAPSYVQRLIEAQSKRDLEWFFDDWVYRDRGLPDLRVESVFPRAIVGGGYMVTVSVQNLGQAGAEVPVTLRVEGGEISKRLLVPAKSKAAIRIEAPTAPQEVVVNDGSVPERDMENNVFKVQAATPR